MASRPLRILVVEDDDASREMMAELLGMTGAHSIALSGTGEGGLERMEACRFDLVITDIGLPGMSGLEMLDKAIRAGLIEVGHVVVCSAYSGIDSLAIARGAHCVPKPVDADRLTGLVASLSAEGPREPSSRARGDQ